MACLCRPAQHHKVIPKASISWAIVSGRPPLAAWYWPRRPALWARWRLQRWAPGTKGQSRKRWLTSDCQTSNGPMPHKTDVKSCSKMKTIFLLHRGTYCLITLLLLKDGTKTSNFFFTNFNSISHLQIIFIHLDLCRIELSSFLDTDVLGSLYDN